MLIAHINFGCGESGWLTAAGAAAMEAAILEQFGTDAVGFYCTDDEWEGATLTAGNLEQIKPGQTGHWMEPTGDKIAIVNLPGAFSQVANNGKANTLAALRNAVAIAADNDRLCDTLDFSFIAMSEVRKDWRGWNFGSCNLEGASFRGCEMGNNDFIDCNLKGCWLPMSETSNIRLHDCTFGV